MAAAAAELAAKLAGTGVGGLDLRPMEKIKAGSTFVVRVAGAVFSTTTSGDRIGKVDVGDRVVATGPPVSQGYYTMVPIRPKGAVDLSMLQPLDLRIRRACAVGSWDGFQKNEMSWDEDMQCYHYPVELGRTGCERFQIECNGDWQMCLHPDRNDSSPHEHHKLCGPGNEGAGKDWVIGKHPADKGGKGVSYLIRLFMHRDGRPKHVDWVRTSEDTESEGEGGRAGAPELQPDAPVIVFGLKGPRGEALNGSEGICEAWDAKAGRWRVRLASGEVRALRPRHLSLCCEDVSGYWQDGRSLVAKIEQDGANIRVTAPCQPWSPAIGSVSGNVLTLTAPPNVPCLAAAILDGDIKWVNDVVWRRGTEQEFRVAVAREAKMKRKALANNQKGMRLGDDDSEEEALREVSGPMAQFLKGSRRGAALEAPEEFANRPRLGVDLKPSLPSRGMSPKFRHRSFFHNRQQEALEGEDPDDEADEAWPKAAQRRPPSPRAARGGRRPRGVHAFALALPAPEPDEDSPPPEPAASSSAAPLPPQSGPPVAGQTVPSIEDVLARLDREEEESQPPALAIGSSGAEEVATGSGAAEAATNASRAEAEPPPPVAAEPLAATEDRQPPQPAASSSAAPPPPSGPSAGGEAVPSIEDLLARLDHEEEAAASPGEAGAPAAAASPAEAELPPPTAAQRSVAAEAFPSIEEVLARLDQEEDTRPPEVAVRSSGVEPPVDEPPAAVGEYFPSVEEVLARLDLEEEPQPPQQPAISQSELGALPAGTEGFPSIEEVLARLDQEPEGVAEVDDYAQSRSIGGSMRSSTRPEEPPREELPTAAAAQAAELPDEPAPDIDGLLARLDREEQEALEREYYQQVADIQRKLAGRL